MPLSQRRRGARRDTVRRALAALSVGLALSGAPPAQADPDPSGGRALQLEVLVNGEPRQMIGSFQELPDGGLAATRKELTEVGIKPPGEGADDELIPLAGMGEVAYAYDEPRQRIEITASDERRMPHVIDARGRVEALPATQSGYGAVLNYTLFGSSTADWEDKLFSFNGGSAQLDARVFTPVGYLQQTAIVGTTLFDDAEVLRLDTAYVFTHADSATTSRAGDLISRGPLWARSIRLGGIQVERDFLLRPDLITAPLPALSGSAAVPSTVEVFVDGTRTFSRNVPAGPYAISNLPAISGGTGARVVLRDASGRIVESTLPFFASPQLLREGLLDYSVQAGFPRFAYAIKSNEYGEKPVGLGSIRYGFNDNLTLEAHAEGGAGLINGGIGAVTNAGGFGVLAVAGRASHAGRDTGFQSYLSFETRLLGFSIGASSQRSFGPFQDLASITAQLAYADDPQSRPGRGSRDPTVLDPLTTGSIARLGRPPRALDRVSIGTQLPFARASLAVSFVNLERDAGDRARILAASYSQTLWKQASLSLTAFTDIENGKDAGFFAGLTMPLGEDVQASVGATGNDNGQFITADASKTLGQEPGSYGWRVRNAQGRDQAYRSAAGAYRSEYGQAEAAVEQFGGGTRVSAEAQGAIVAVPSGVFLSNKVDDAFAVVDVGAPDVEVFHENRSIGKTGASGKILVPSLRSHQKNRIKMDPTNLPVDAHVTRTDEIVVPGRKAGVTLDFGVEAESRDAVLILHDRDGHTLPAGLRAQLDGQGEPVIIGYDGRAFLRGLARSNTVVVELPEGECRASFDYAPEPGRQVVIGPVPCL
jgi:outer membrane usher protein